MKLLGSKLLIKPLEKETKTASGLVLPDTISKDKMREAIVIEIGTGSRNEDGDKIEIEVKKGEKILYKHSEYATDEIMIDGVVHYIVNESDVVAVL